MAFLLKIFVYIKYDIYICTVIITIELAATAQYGKNIMKTSIDFLNGLQVTNTANFQKNVIELLPAGVEKIYLRSCGMKRASGYGSYNYFLDLEINGEDIVLKEHTHSSPAWDEFQDLEYGTRNFENCIKRIALMILEEKKDEIIELIEPENE